MIGLGAVNELQGENAVPGILELGDGLVDLFLVAPRHISVLVSSNFRDGLVRRRWRNAGQNQLFDFCRIGDTKDRADIYWILDALKKHDNVVADRMRTAEIAVKALQCSTV